MILVPWDDDELPHGEPMTPGRALAWGLVLVLIVLLVVVRGGAQLVVGMVS